MKKGLKTKIIVFAAALVIALASFGTGMIFGAGSYEPGTQGDPIVTLSYLEKRLAEKDGVTLPSDGESGSFKKLSLTKGQSVTLDEGSMIMVFNGGGEIFGDEGLISMTGSELFAGGTSAVLYNLYLSPGKGNGIIASSKTVFYVLGGYYTD